MVSLKPISHAKQNKYLRNNDTKQYGSSFLHQNKNKTGHCEIKLKTIRIVSHNKSNQIATVRYKIKLWDI